MPDNGSLSEKLERWRAGDQAAATEIYTLYEQRVRRLAERKLGPRLQSRIDPDDVMLSVLNTVLKRIRHGQYSVDPSGSLWNLLRVVTHNKIRKQAEFHGAGKRDVGVEVDFDADGLLPDIAPRGPTPEEAAILADELENIRKLLKPEDFEIFELQFQGYSHVQIAQRLGCARQTVRYKTNRLEQRLRSRADAHSD